MNEFAIYFNLLKRSTCQLWPHNENTRLQAYFNLLFRHKHMLTFNTSNTAISKAKTVTVHNKL